MYLIRTHQAGKEDKKTRNITNLNTLIFVATSIFKRKTRRFQHGNVASELKCHYDENFGLSF